MAEENNGKNKWMGILIGPALTFFALCGLWKNETRFDFYKAAAATPVVNSPNDASEGQPFSLTGSMDTGLTLQGQYAEQFKGFLQVRRSAEIYAWDKETKDNKTTWRKKWMSKVESNSRNNGISQELSSKRFMPDKFEVGKLTIESRDIEFVDSTVNIEPSSLQMNRKGLVIEGGYFYLRKNDSRQIGDERISYVGIPIPATATYFGKFETGRGVADRSNERTGWINKLIQDNGILHHLVAGDRPTALASIKAYLNMIKWIIRGIGTACVVIGLLILFATIFSWLYVIPVIGPLAEMGSFVLAILIGLPIAIFTICASYLIAHPILLGLIIGGMIVAIYFLRRRGNTAQTEIKSQIDQHYGHEIQPLELKDLEFIELAKMAIADGMIAPSEHEFLNQWAKKHRWEDGKRDELIQKALESQNEESDFSSDEHLMNLIRLALADGQLSRYEIKSIRRAATSLGYDEPTVMELINRVRYSVSS